MSLLLHQNDKDAPHVSLRIRVPRRDPCRIKCWRVPLRDPCRINYWRVPLRDPCRINYWWVPLRDPCRINYWRVPLRDPCRIKYWWVPLMHSLLFFCIKCWFPNTNEDSPIWVASISATQLLFRAEIHTTHPGLITCVWAIHLLQKTKKALVGFMTFWLRLVNILSYMDLC